MIEGTADPMPGSPREMHGRPTRRLGNDHCWFEFLTEGGPRVVGLGLPGGENLLAETPEASWDSGYGRYDLVGGHRLWFAPEAPECSAPDSSGLRYEVGPDYAQLQGAVEAPTGLRKRIHVQLDPKAAVLTLIHTLCNEGSKTLELAPWPVTQLRLGGVAFVALPLPVTEHLLAPGSSVAMWPYASWADSRLSFDHGLLEVQGRSGPAFKVGCWTTASAMGYLRDQVLFVKRFDPAPSSRHPDAGCNAELHADESAIELEALGPLVKLAPGRSVARQERWELHVVEPEADLLELVGRYSLR